MTCRIDICQGDSRIESDVGKIKERSLLGGAPFSDPIEKGEKFLNALLRWSESEFSMFAFDIVALLAGKYSASGPISSFHGLSTAKCKK